ncbi:hypothetical protein [Arthrobacter sp. D1-17]
MRQQSNLQSNAVAVVRLVAGFAGFGAGSVTLAISSSLFTAAAGRPLLLVPAIATALWGTALLGWTVAALRRGSFPWPRLSSALLLTAAALHVLSIIGGGGTDLAGLNISHLAALLLTLTMVAAQAWLRRQAGLGDAAGTASGTLSAGAGTVSAGAGAGAASVGGGAGPVGAGAGAGRLLLGAFAGAVAIAAITTPGLAASTAGQFAVPHSSHSDGSHSDGGHSVSGHPIGGSAGHHGP